MSMKDWSTRSHKEDTSYWTQLQLPYEAPSHLRPAIPSYEEIDEAMMNSRRLTGYWGQRDICRMEAEGLFFLRANSKVRVPTLYAAFSRKETIEDEILTQRYMVQEYIEGHTLSDER
ncbi:hypothetical protein J1614_003536 [Plenodomus biglobosus]|nr:hypothetical protein J1614_003536 [Plenodomus biglobosus]